MCRDAGLRNLQQNVYQEKAGKARAAAMADTVLVSSGVMKAARKREGKRAAREKKRSRVLIKS